MWLFQLVTEYIFVNRRVLTSLAVESEEVSDIGRTALRNGVKASRADGGDSAGSEEGNSRELHFEGGWRFWYSTRS